MANIRSFKELRVWQNAMGSAMRVFELTKGFPAEERYSLTDQFRRASRSVASNIAEAWRKRRYAGAFVSKLNSDCPWVTLVRVFASPRPRVSVSPRQLLQGGAP